MSNPSRADAVAILEAGRARLDALLTSLSDEQLSRPATIGGGDWSAKDLIGHVATWEEMALEALKGWREGTTPWFDQEPYVGPGSTDRINAATIERKSSLSLRQIRMSAEQTHRQLVSSIQALTDEEWSSKMVWREEEITLAGRLGSLTAAVDGPFRHAFDHIPDLEVYVASLPIGRNP